jgi:amino acid transporter
MQGVALWIILLAVFWADAGHSRRLLEYLLLQPKVAIQSSVRHNASESHRRRAVTDYITVIALLCFVVGFIARWIQHGQSNVWLDVVAAIAGTFFILVFFIGRLYAAFPLKSELRNPRVRKWAAMPAVILITILVGLLLIYLIGEWSLVLMGAGKQ